MKICTNIDIHVMKIFKSQSKFNAELPLFRFIAFRCPVILYLYIEVRKTKKNQRLLLSSKLTILHLIYVYMWDFVGQSDEEYETNTNSTIWFSTMKIILCAWRHSYVDVIILRFDKSNVQKMLILVQSNIGNC